MLNFTIYGDNKSGNCYKIQLVCALLNIDYDWVDVDIMKGECQTPSFKALNPNAKIPLLVLSNGKNISESNAIINYLASNSNLLPNNNFELAKVQQWQFFEQYSHEPFIAVARFINKYLGLPANRMHEYESKQAGGHKALRIMNNELGKSTYLVGNNITCADISLYAYTHVAHEGGFDLNQYPNIQAWMQKIKSLPNYIAMHNG